MAQRMREVMTSDPVTIGATATIQEAAQAMRQADIGDVIVMQDSKVCGILTDRDIVVRALADGKDPKSTRVQEICTSELATLSPSDSVDDAVEVMRQQAVRRVPVVEGKKPVGVVSLGDLAVERDRRSALADISAAPANT